MANMWKFPFLLENKRARLIANNKDIQVLFDNDWYKRKYPDVAASGIDPCFHYLKHGAFEGRDPHPLFSTGHYLERYPAVKSSGINPLLHYLRYGWKEGYEPYPLIDSNHIFEQTGVRIAGLSGYASAAASGKRINPHPLFDVDYYLGQLPSSDIRALDPLSHYIWFGAELGLDPHPFFSTNFYLARYGDVAQSGFNPLAHFVAFGAAEGRDPHPAFETSWYKQKQMQFADGAQNPLEHFVITGQQKNASPHPLFPMKGYKSLKGEEIPRNRHPLVHALEGKDLHFDIPHMEVDKRTTLEKQRSKVRKFVEIEAFIVFNTDAISGGVFSIFSIAEELRKIGHQSVMYSLPGGPPIVRYKRFNNKEIILPFSDLIAAFEEGKIKRVHIPEVLLETVNTELSKLTDGYDLRKVNLNILNQNNELMPRSEVLLKLSSKFGNMTMTTAHERYSTQMHADRWGVPLKHLSTYVSYDDYSVSQFSQKNNIILLSPDRMSEDHNFEHFMHNFFPGYEVYRIRALHYEFYKFSLNWCKFCVTLGEGLDNYFIETIFTGGIAFAIYNPVFMPEEMKHFPNVFRSLEEMQQKISTMMRDIEMDDVYREEVWRKNYELLKSLYDKNIYRRKVREFSAGKFDFEPGQV